MAGRKETAEVGNTAPPAFGSFEYWQQRYISRLELQHESHVAEWYTSIKLLFPVLKPLLQSPLENTSDVENCTSTGGGTVLYAGCGESTAAHELLRNSLASHVVCCDWSSCCIDAQMKRSGDEQKKITFVNCDIAAGTGCDDASLDGALDKACVDATFCANNSFERARALVLEIARCLKPGAPFVCVSVAEPRDRLWLFEAAQLTACVHLLSKQQSTPSVTSGANIDDKGIQETPIWLSGNANWSSELNTNLGSHRLSRNSVYYVYIAHKPPNMQTSQQPRMSNQ